MKRFPANPTFLLLTALLFVSGCAQTVTRTEVVHTQIDCEPIPYPRKIVLREVYPQNMGDYWRFSHADYAAMREWVVEFERYLKDVRAMTDSIKTCISDYNATLKAADAPPPKPSLWSKLKFWSRDEESEAERRDP